ncbi:MAG: hypothetical protein QXE01_03670 [Sulfolobales archaeon]
MVERITKYSLYLPLLKRLKDVGRQNRVEIPEIQKLETSVQRVSHKLLVQIDINRVSKLVKDLVKSYPITIRGFSNTFKYMWEYWENKLKNTGWNSTMWQKFFRVFKLDTDYFIKLVFHPISFLKGYREFRKRFSVEEPRA